MSVVFEGFPRSGLGLSLRKVSSKWCLYVYAYSCAVAVATVWPPEEANLLLLERASLPELGGIQNLGGHLVLVDIMPCMWLDSRHVPELMFVLYKNQKNLIV